MQYQEIIKFKDNATGEIIGESHQLNVPRKDEIVFINNAKYSVERVIWVYSASASYPLDPFTYEDVFVFLNFIVGYPSKAKHVFAELETNKSKVSQE